MYLIRSLKSSFRVVNIDPYSHFEHHKMKAMHQLSAQPILILAGGFGTRLKSAVADVPKPLAPVGGKTFLDFLIRSLYRQGFRQIDLSLHHEAAQIVNWAEKTEKPANLKIRYVIESEPFGTAGAIAYARTYFGYDNDLFVCNGDTYLSNGAFEIAAENNPENCIGAVSVQDTGRYGSLEFSDDGLIRNFAEKSELKKPGFINSGLYLLKNELLQSLEIKAHSLERDIFPALVKQKKLRAVALKSLFIDIGIPEDYNLFVQMVQNKEVLESW